MNLYQFAASASNERVNIYMLSKIYGKPVVDFDRLRLRSLFDNMQKPFIFTAIYQERTGLYGWRKVHPIDCVAEYKPRYSLYQRSKKSLESTK